MARGAWEIVKLLIKLPLLLVLTAGMGVGLYLAGAAVLCVLWLMCPAVSCYLLMHESKMHWALAILLWPFLTTLLALASLLLLLTYPCTRLTYHHGVFDGLDAWLNARALNYLNFTTWLLSL